MRLLYLVLMAAALLLSSVAEAQTIAVEGLSQPQALSGQWKFHEGDDPRWAQPGFDDSQWSSIDIPASVNQQFGQRWYRVHVSLPAATASEPLGLLVGPFGSAFAYEVFADGQRIGSVGGFRPTELRLPTVAAFPLPPQPKGELVLAFRVRSIPSAYTIPAETAASVSFLGTLAGVRTQEKLWHAERLSGRLNGLLISAAIAMATLFFVTLPLTRKGSREYFWFGLFLLGGLGFRLIPLYPEALGLERVVTSNLGMAISLSGGVLIFPFLLIELFASRHTLIGWLGAALMYAMACTAMASQLFDSPLPIETQRTLILGATVVWFIYYFPFAWRYSTIRGQLPAMHAVLLFHMSGTLIQHFAVRYFQLTESQGLGMQTIRLLTLLLVTFAMAILLNRRAARMDAERQRLGGELAAASEVQSLLLSAPTATGHYAVDAVYLPASEVGGDFYQVLDRESGARLVVVGDVSGKGLRAAMLVSVAVGALRAAQSDSPAAVLAVMNRALCGRSGGGFVTCCCVRVDPNGEAVIANAGHLPPYLAGREAETDPGLPLGIVPGAEYTETRVSLARGGGALVLFSDGVVEAENAQRELFGFDRTRDISTKSAQEIAEAAKAWGQNDDITVVTVRRNA
ncbi:MAG: SpoIIE family protein phosphatase [Acidobacteria bacterium]|nr:SpoIIE family protein phosphatase [Acidobacteriota bacterium]